MRLRRHVGPGFFDSMAGRRLVRDIALLIGVFIIGYGLAFLWLKPGPIVTRDHAVPHLIEVGATEARARLERVQLKARFVGDRPHPSVARNAVVWQDPPAGTVVPAGTTVQLVTSTGPAPLAVPDVIGLAAMHAAKVLEAAGFERGVVDSVPGGTEAGVVLATRPAAGTAREPGAPVDLVVSRGDGVGR